MAQIIWQGDASVVAQVDSLTPGGTIEANDKFIVTLTDEGGTSASVTTSATGTTVAQTVADIVAQCSASTDTRFAAVTFSDETTAVHVTANTAGVPFSCTVSTTESDDSAADLQTFVRASVTASSGPHDWGVGANWKSGTVPVDDDDVVFNQGSVSALYSLDQSAVNLKSFRISPMYRGTIGNTDKQHYLKIDVASTAGGNTPILANNSGGNGCLIDGTITNVKMISSVRSANALKLKGDVDDVYILGSQVTGTITLGDSMVLDNIYVLGATGSVVKVGKSITSFDLVEMTSGNVQIDSTLVTLNISGGQATYGVTVDEDPVLTNLNQRGGRTKYNSGGTLTSGMCYGGEVTLNETQAGAVTITTCIVFDGVWRDESALVSSTYTNNIQKRGGDVKTIKATIVEL